MDKDNEIEKLKSALVDAVRSFTRVETLYKLKCDEIAGLTGKVEALQKDNENLRRTLEYGREAIKEAKKETAHEIFERVNKWIDEIVPHTKEWTILFCLLGWINTKYGVEDDE